MIKNKKNLIEYLNADKVALGRTHSKPKHTYLICKYQILLRKCEYYNNCKTGFINRLIYKYYNLRRFILVANVTLICIW